MRRIFLSIFTALMVYSSSIAQLYDKQDATSLDKQSLNKSTVTIGGSFIVNGSFLSLPSERTDQFITRIYNTSKIDMLTAAKNVDMQNLILKQFKDYPRRNIRLKHINGTENIIDLEKFRMTGDFKYNPYLGNDDVLIFPAINMDKDFVEISGAVNKNVRFQFVEGDKLSDALIFAQGVDQSYENVFEAQISRLNYKGDKEELITAKLAEDYSLQRGDRIRVIGTNGNKRGYKVLVLGEVNSPGYIYITKDNSTIREVINKAGGFTDKASLSMAELIRNSSASEILRANSLREMYEAQGELDPQIISELSSMKAYERLSMLRMHDMIVEDSVYFTMDNLLRILKPTGTIDFTSIFSDSSDQGNFLVRDGDVVLIPEQVNTVYVFGQVNKTGYVNYKKGMNYNYYITQAGGLGRTAQDEIRIIKAKSRAWIEADALTVIEPGDYVYVP
jgi:protein involved in polysaccharide export with SLBB domain